MKVVEATCCPGGVRWSEPGLWFGSFGLYGSRFRISRPDMQRRKPPDEDEKRKQCVVSVSETAV